MSEFIRQNYHLTPLDIIVSCSVCQRSISDIYATPEQGDGLRQGPDLGNGKITRLWLTECGHFTCTKHLAGGGPQFHPSSQKPQAPCPLCSRERGDLSNKTLFWVNGVSSGEYSFEIPKAYFQTPPLRLGGDDPDLEAMRFQYLSLIRFGSTKQAKVVRLENKLKIWEDRRPLFKHCVAGFDTLQRELQAAREKLLELGQDVASIDATLKITRSNPAENRNHATTQLASDLTSDQTLGSNPNHINTRNRSRLAQASANDLDEIKNSSNVVKESRYVLGMRQDYALGSSDSSGGKRRRIESRCDNVTQRAPAYQSHQSPKIRSRDAMPPPSLPGRLLRTSQAAFNAQNGRTINSPIPEFLPPVNVSRKSILNPNAPNFYSSGHSPICSGTDAPFYLTQNHHGSLFATGRRHRFSPHASADRVNPPQMLPQGFREQPYLTPLHQDQYGVQSFPQGKQGSNETISSQLDRIRIGSYVNPYGQNLMDSRELDVTCAGMNGFSDTIAKADPIVRQAESNRGFPKDRPNRNPCYRNGDHREIPSRTGNISRGVFSTIGSERLGSRNNRTDINDGELDQNMTQTSSLINSIFKTTPTRVSLPPRGPSSIGTPRLRIGMSANARSSRNIFIPPTPTRFRPHREPLNNMATSNPYVSSPYFSHQNLPLPPQNSSPLADPSKSPGQTRTFVEAPFRIDQRLQIGRNRTVHEYLKGRSSVWASSPVHRAGREDRSYASSMRRARR